MIVAEAFAKHKSVCMQRWKPIPTSTAAVPGDDEVLAVCQNPGSIRSRGLGWL